MLNGQRPTPARTRARRVPRAAPRVPSGCGTGTAAGPGQVVLGTDYPFDMGVTDPVARAAAAGLPAANRTAILGGNAATLFGLGPCPAPS
ncbi:MAG TPA: amidohydrolase family protein [Trebonia sp.]|nr:amidohydrolase family protein [Trebonia sp.]